jgi:hypothetical protein
MRLLSRNRAIRDSEYFGNQPDGAPLTGEMSL